MKLKQVFQEDSRAASLVLDRDHCNCVGSCNESQMGQRVKDAIRRCKQKRQFIVDLLVSWLELEEWALVPRFGPGCLADVVAESCSPGGLCKTHFPGPMSCAWPV